VTKVVKKTRRNPRNENGDEMNFGRKGRKRKAGQGIELPGEKGEQTYDRKSFGSARKKRNIGGGGGRLLGGQGKGRGVR